MTIPQLITELEKPRKNYPQGVLTWEAGDVYRNRIDDTAYTEDLGLCPSDGWIQNQASTHSPDDPRLLGRVLLAIIPIYGGYQIRDHGGAHVSIWDRTPDNPAGNWIEESGDTLLEATLKALLAKVEGEQS